jgi:hypothetical protein
MRLENTQVVNVTSHADNFCDEGLLRTLLVIKPKDEVVDVFKVNLLGNQQISYKIRTKHS